MSVLSVLSLLLIFTSMLVLFLFVLFVVFPVASPPEQGTRQRPDGGHDSDSAVYPGYFSLHPSGFSFLSCAL